MTTVQVSSTIVFTDAQHTVLYKYWGIFKAKHGTDITLNEFIAMAINTDSVNHILDQAGQLALHG